MKKLFFLICLTICSLSFSQNDSTIDFWDNVRFGGGFGLNFGNNITTVSVNPTAVYDFNEKISLGTSLGYTYNKNGDYKSNIYTASILSLFQPFDGVEMSAELEQLFVNSKLGSLSNNYNYPALYLGLAYRIRNISIGGRFDILYKDDKSIYTSPFTPFIRVFF